MLNKLTSPISAILLFICIAIPTSYFGSESKRGPNVSEAPTAELFAMTLPDENGNPQALNRWQGKAVVLNFWATWCGPCREEMPDLSELHTEYKGKNVVVLGIALDEIDAIKEFAEKTPVSYPLFSAENVGGQLAANLGNDKNALPYTVVIKPDGTIASAYFGRISKALLEETLVKLLP
jgi:peroxiredoxin